MEELLKSVNNLNEQHQKQREEAPADSQPVQCMDCQSQLPKHRAGIMKCVCKELSVYCPDCLQTAENCPKCKQKFSQLRENLLVKRQIDTARTKQKIINIMVATSLTVRRYDSSAMVRVYQCQMFEVVDELRQNFKKRLETEIRLVAERELESSNIEDNEDMKELDRILKQFRGEGEEQGDFKTVMNSVNSYMTQKRQEQLQNNPQIIVVNAPQ